MIEQRARGSGIVLLLTMAALNATLYAGLLLLEYAYGWIGTQERLQNFLYLLGIPVACVLSFSNIERLRMQQREHPLLESLAAALRFVFYEGAAIFALYFFLKDVGISRLFLLVYLIAALLLNWVVLFVGPTGLGLFLFGRRSRLRAVVYGEGPMPPDLGRYLEQSAAMGIELMGYYADKALQLKEVEWLGTRDEVLTCEGGRKRLRADVVFAYTEKSGYSRFREHMDYCLQHGARVHIYSNLADSFRDPVKLVSDGPVQFVTFFDEPLQNPVNITVKRALDIAVSLPVVLFLLPPLILFVRLIHWVQSPGPLFFKQKRYGMNRRPFTILKFRSMHVHDRDEESRQATRGDQRIFSLGAFLRKSSIDEFPQFVNVLRGEMSVVGPRPHLTLHDAEFEQFHERYRSRHFVKPGITGLAQVNGFRGEIQNEAAILGRVELDHRYISKWTIWKDLAIIFRTAWQVVFPPKSAY